MALEMESLLDVYADELEGCEAVLDAVADEASVLVGAYEHCVQALEEETNESQRFRDHAKNMDLWFVSLLLALALIACAVISWKLGKACATRKYESQDRAAQLRLINFHLSHSEDQL